MLRGALRLGAVLGAVLVSASSPAASNERPREPKSPIPFAPHPIEVNSTHDEALARCRSAGVSCRIVLGQPGQSIFETLAVAGREDPSLALEVRRDLLEDLERARRSTPVEVSTRFPGETPESLWATLTRALSLLDGKRRSLGGPSLGNQLAIRIRGSGDLKNNYDWYYEREEPYAICDGSNCAYRGTLHIYYDQDLNGYQMRYWHSFTADRESTTHSESSPTTSSADATEQSTPTARKARTPDLQGTHGTPTSASRTEDDSSHGTDTTARSSSI